MSNYPWRVKVTENGLLVWKGTPFNRNITFYCYTTNLEGEPV